MARPRTPTSMLELSGSADRNAARMERQGRGTEPKPVPTLGDAPATLTENQQAIWHELTDQIPPSVATKADRMVVEICVRMIERMRLGTARSADYATLLRGLSQLGLTPADRSKIHVPEAAVTEHDPFNEFVNA